MPRIDHKKCENRELNHYFSVYELAAYLMGGHLACYLPPLQSADLPILGK